MPQTIDRFRRAAARRFRTQETSAAKQLWEAIERIPLEGTHFRRQAPIGPYVADFACLSYRLLIEVDGPSHTTDPGQARDAIRTAWLQNEGYRVFRFWNQEIYDNLDGVLDTIFAALSSDASMSSPCITPPRRLRHRPFPSRGG